MIVKVLNEQIMHMNFRILPGKRHRRSISLRCPTALFVKSNMIKESR